MKRQATQVRSVIYDALARRFEGDISFLDTRGAVRRVRVKVRGQPDWAHSTIVAALVAAVHPSRNPA